MRPLAVIPVLLFSIALRAQAFERNRLELWDRTAEFSDRGALGAAAGQFSQKFPWGAAAVPNLTSVQYVVQDQDASTVEMYHVALAGTNKEGLPDYAGSVRYASFIRLPFATGTAAWLVTHNFDSLVNPPLVPPNDGTGFHHCWQVPANAAWPSDGISVHWSQGAPYNGTLLCYQSFNHREIPRTEGTQIVSELGWSEVPNGNPGAAFQNRAWRIAITSDAATLHGGAANPVYNCLQGDPNPGYASLDPDFDNAGNNASVPRFDDPAWFVEAGPSHANGVVVLFHALALGPNANGITVPGWSGRFLLDVTDPLFGVLGVTTLDAWGAGTVTVKLGGASSPIRPIVAAMPSWISQAVALVPSANGVAGEFTNVFTMRPKKGFGSSSVFRAVNLSATNPVSIPRGASDRCLYVRNDGAGTVVVGQYAGQTQLPGSWTVNDRTAMRVPASAMATRFVLSTAIVKPTSRHSGVNVLYALNF